VLASVAHWKAKAARSKGASNAAPLFILAGSFQSTSLAAEEFLSEGGELVMRELTLLVQVHLLFGSLSATPLPLLSYVPLVISHSIPSEFGAQRL
jgi:hypothetical protein